MFWKGGYSLKIDNWKTRYRDSGVCDFRRNYDFYFKWLLNKVCSCFYIKGLNDTKIDETYLKSNLILDGAICVTDFGKDLYACIGNRGGQPDEYYVPTIFTIANPILGSKQVRIGQDGVVIYNTEIDRFAQECFSGGLYDLISQTATLLADNIISINCQQINSRVVAIFTADSDGQALAGEAILKRMYAGKPYDIIRQDLIEKINVNPIAGANVGQNLTELVELHNYIIGNFFQSIGIKSNNQRKKERLINAEINAQNDFLEISILEILTSWQKGFDAVNEMYGTDIHVELNPVLVEDLVESVEDVAGDDASIQTGESIMDDTQGVEGNEEPEVETVDNVETEEVETVETEEVETVETEEPESIQDVIEEKEENVETIIDAINDVEGGEEDDSESTEESLESGDSE